MAAAVAARYGQVLLRDAVARRPVASAAEGGTILILYCRCEQLLPPCRLKAGWFDVEHHQCSQKYTTVARNEFNN